MVPKADEEARMKAFFNCVACLMQHNLEALFHDSVTEFKDFICCKLVSIALNLKETKYLIIKLTL